MLRYLVYIKARGGHISKISQLLMYAILSSTRRLIEYDSDLSLETTVRYCEAKLQSQTLCSNYYVPYLPFHNHTVPV